MDEVVIDQLGRLLAQEATEARLRQARAGQTVDGWDANGKNPKFPGVTLHRYVG